ncbi:hypothetical protein [Micromonospora sp. NPDC049240]|uniref:hypothetical protein n=1 Tax=Micromonospora sp. NPDC049240 TaxID=3155151 RepID=UPI0033ED9289
MTPELEELPVIRVAETPTILVLKSGEGIAGWASVFSDGSAWIVQPDARTMVHSGSVRTLVNFWAQVFDCEVGIPKEAV